MEIPTKCHDLALKIACDSITEKCITKECEHCPSFHLEAVGTVLKFAFIHGRKEKSAMKSS